MQTIALFGTSADPPTAGHQAILIWLAQRFDQVAVWASDNPFKSHQTPLHHRQHMLELLIRDLPQTPQTPQTTQTDRPQKQVQLYPELSHPRALITVDRARHLWPQAEFTLVIGSDLVPQLPRWYEIATLLQQVRLLIVPRPGYHLNDADLWPLRQMGATLAIADLSAPAVSSSTYREVHSPELITPPIQAYIHQEHLYNPNPCQRNPSSSNPQKHPSSLMPQS
jgi:nicotinate-nucleotide adenylyltransferase